MLHLPLDIESLPEFRRLRAAVGDPRASHALLRLWVELGYAAGSPGGALGVLRADAAGLTTDELGPLVEAGWLTRAANAPEEDASAATFHCPRFLQWHPHLAPDYVKFQKKGNLLSLPSRREKKIAAVAAAQGDLIAAEFYKDRAGRTLDAATAQQCRMLILQTDRCLGRPLRREGEYSEGLFADAAEIVTVHSSSDLVRFYRWLMLRRAHPAVPRTTEQILAQWSTVWAMLAAPEIAPRL